jgi:hypothetical protein
MLEDNKDLIEEIFDKQNTNIKDYIDNNTIKLDGYKGVRDDGTDVRIFIKKEIINDIRLYSINTNTKTVTGVFTFDGEGRSESLTTNVVYILSGNKTLNVGDIYTLEDVLKVSELNATGITHMEYTLVNGKYLTETIGGSTSISNVDLIPSGATVAKDDIIDDGNGTVGIVDSVTSQTDITVVTTKLKAYDFDIVTTEEILSTGDYNIELKNDTSNRFWVYKVVNGNITFKISGTYQADTLKTLYSVGKATVRSLGELIISSQNLNVGNPIDDKFAERIVNEDTANCIIFKDDASVTQYTDFRDLGDLVSSTNEDDIIGINPKTGAPLSFKGSGTGGIDNIVVIASDTDLPTTDVLPNVLYITTDAHKIWQNPTAGTELTDWVQLNSGGGGGGIAAVNAGNGISIPDPTVPVVSAKKDTTLLDNILAINAEGLYVPDREYTVAEFLALYDSSASDVVANETAQNKLTLHTGGTPSEGITSITSTLNSLTIDNPTGPAVDINFKAQTGDLTITNGIFNIGSQKVINDRLALRAVQPKNILASGTIGQVLRTTAANTVDWADAPTPNNNTITIHQDGITTDQTFTLNQATDKTINLIGGGGGGGIDAVNAGNGISIPDPTTPVVSAKKDTTLEDNILAVNADGLYVPDHEYTVAEFLALYDSAGSDVVANETAQNKLTLHAGGTPSEGITSITSTQNSLTVDNPTGPAVDINFKAQTGDLTVTNGIFYIGNLKVDNDKIALRAVQPKNVLASTTIGQVLKTTAANTVDWADAPTVNNNTITIHQDGVTTDQTFTLNQGADKTINLISGGGGGDVIQKTVYVDPVNGVDTNDGRTYDKPIKTAAKIFEILESKIVRTVSIAAGTLNAFPTMTGLSDVEFAATGAVIINLASSDFIISSDNIRFIGNFTINSTESSNVINDSYMVIFNSTHIGVSHLNVIDSTVRFRGTAQVMNIRGNGILEFYDTANCTGGLAGGSLKGLRDHIFYTDDNYTIGNENNHDARDWNTDYHMLSGVDWINIYTNNNGQKVWAKYIDYYAGEGGTIDTTIDIGSPAGVTSKNLFAFYGNSYSASGTSDLGEDDGQFDGNVYWFWGGNPTTRMFSMDYSQGVSTTQLRLHYMGAAPDNQIHVTGIVLFEQLN